MTGRPQGDCAAEWRARAARLRERSAALPDDPATLHRPPLAGGWSVGQVLEHLILATGSYLAVMRQRVEAAPAGTGAAPPWRPTLAGRLLAGAMTSPRRFPAPRAWVPDPVPRPHVREAWTATLRELEVLLDRAEPLPWTRLRFGSPVNPLLRLNLGDGFLVMVAHAERHVGQIDRLVAGGRDPAAS